MAFGSCSQMATSYKCASIITMLFSDKSKFKRHMSVFALMET